MYTLGQQMKVEFMLFHNFSKDVVVMYNWLNFILDGLLYWIDGGNIKGGAFADPADYGSIYSGVVVVHFKVVANYIYAISSDT